MSKTQETYMNQKRHEILDLTGNEKWADVIEWFGNMTEKQIYAECKRCWPNDDSRQLASDIRYELDRVC